MFKKNNLFKFFIILSSCLYLKAEETSLIQEDQNTAELTVCDRGHCSCLRKAIALVNSLQNQLNFALGSRRIIEGSFFTNGVIGSQQPILTGSGFTVVYNGPGPVINTNASGVYTITFSQPFNSIPTLVGNNDQNGEFEPRNGTSPTTTVINLLDFDYGNHSGHRVSFIAVG